MWLYSIFKYSGPANLYEKVLATICLRDNIRFVSSIVFPSISV